MYCWSNPDMHEWKDMTMSYSCAFQSIQLYDIVRVLEPLSEVLNHLDSWSTATSIDLSFNNVIRYHTSYFKPRM